MPGTPKAPANVEEQAGSAAANPLASRDEQHPLANNLMKYMMQSLTQWQVNKIEEFVSDAEVITLLEEWQVTREENMQLMDLVMQGQVKAHEISRQLANRLADLEDEAADKMSLQTQAASLPSDNMNTETSDDLPPAAKAGKMKAAGSMFNPGGTTSKAPPPVLPPKEARARLDADTDAGRDPANRPIAVSELLSRGEVTHRWDQAERVRKEREDKEEEARVRQDKIRRELQDAELIKEMQQEDKGNKVRPEIAVRFRYEEELGDKDQWLIGAEKEIARQDAAAKATMTPSPTSPAEEEEVTYPLTALEEPMSDSEVDVEEELMKHPEWTDEVEEAGDIAANWAENRNCSHRMQIRAASRARRKRVQKLRNDAERALQANKDAGKRAPSMAGNDPLGLQRFRDTSTRARLGFPEASGPASSGGGGAMMGAGTAANRPSTSCRRRNMPLGEIKKLVFTRPKPTSGFASRDIRILVDGTMITPEEEALERAVGVAAELLERRLLPRQVSIRLPVTRPIEQLSTDEVLHFFPKDNYGIPKVLREGDNWIRTVIAKNLNEMLSEDEFIGRYLEPYGELTFTSLERFESHRVNACGRPKQYMIATFRNWMGAIRCLLAVNGIPRDPELPSGRPYEVNLFNCNVDEVRHGPKINDGKRFGAECLGGNGMWHSRIPWRNSRGQLTYPEYEWWWNNIRGGSDANLISLHRQINEPDESWIESYERETGKKVRSLERP